MSRGRFASATSVALDTGSPKNATSQRYNAEIVDGWDIMGNANGGYMMGLVGRAALTSTKRPDVVSMSANFLSPGKTGTVALDIEHVRIGRRFATVRSTMFAANNPKPLMIATVICGDVTAHDGPTMVSVEPPDIPELDDCEQIEPTDTFPPPFVGNLDLRLHPGDTGGYLGRPSAHGKPQFRGWFRLPDREPMDSLAVVLAGDALPPPVFNSALTVGWSPTVQLTVYIHARPTTDWLLIDQRSDIIDGGAFETVTTIFDQTKKVIGRARQLQLLALA